MATFLVCANVQSGHTQSRAQTVPGLSRADPRDVVRQIAAALRTGDVRPIYAYFDPPLADTIMGDLDLLQAVVTGWGAIDRIEVTARRDDDRWSLFELEVEHIMRGRPGDLIVGAGNKSY
jgi:hypothetical protein